MPIFRVLIIDWEKLDRGLCFNVMQGQKEAVEKAVEQKQFVTYELPATDAAEVFNILNYDHPANYRQRSLSVGDVVIDLTTKERWIVAPRGWIPTQVGDAS